MNGYGAPTMYGVPMATWNSWSAYTQQKYLEDYNRTQEQADYYKWESQSLPYNLAYTYTGVIDAIFGTESVETGEDVNQIVEDLKDKSSEILDTGKDITILLALGGLLLLMSK